MWPQARNFLAGARSLRGTHRPGFFARRQENAPSGCTGEAVADAVLPRAGSGDRPAVSICVASGKGGTGKSLLSASLSVLLAERRPTLVLDADFGVGNAHILHDVHPERSVADFVEQRCPLREVVVPCGGGVDLVPGGSGYARLASLEPGQMLALAAEIEDLERDYAYLVVDGAAGISSQTVSFAAAADIVLVVTTPDVTALTDAYAFLKVLWQRRASALPLLIVNRVESEDEARGVAARICGVSYKFLQRRPRYSGFLVEDRAAFRSVQRRRPVVSAEPDSPLAQALRVVARRVCEECDRTLGRGLGRGLASTDPCGPRSA